MRHRFPPRAVGDLVGNKAPPITLLADAPTGEPALDDRVHLQAGGVVSTGAMRFAGKQHGQVDQHRDRWVHAAKGLLNGLPVVADRLQLTHFSIIRSIVTERGFVLSSRLVKRQE